MSLIAATSSLSKLRNGADLANILLFENNESDAFFSAFLFFYFPPLFHLNIVIDGQVNRFRFLTGPCMLHLEYFDKSDKKLL